MKILWVKTDFLHPTTRGGQIRTLQMLRQLHRSHEIHYVAFHEDPESESVRRATEYCAERHPIPHRVPDKASPGFLLQLARGLLSRTPVVVDRYRSNAMKRRIDELCGQQHFDRVVSDFLSPAANIGDLTRCVLFQHNVETMIWRRLAQHASNPLSRWYLGGQAKRMFEFERHGKSPVLTNVENPDIYGLESTFYFDCR